MISYREMFNFIIDSEIDAFRKGIDDGFNVNEADEYGFLLIHRACANNQHEILSLLIKQGSKLENLGGKDNWSPIHLTAISGSLGCATELAKSGANPNIQDIYGRTALHLSITSRNPEIAKELIHIGALKDAKDFNNNTSLDLARQKGAVAFYEILS